MERNNGFAANWWGVFCRAVRDFLSAFDVPVMAYVGVLILWTCLMAFIEEVTIGDFQTPTWWVGPTGLFALTVGGIFVKATGGYFIASKYNSNQGEPPKLPSNAPDPGIGAKP